MPIPTCRTLIGPAFASRPLSQWEDDIVATGTERNRKELYWIINAAFSAAGLPTHGIRPCEWFDDDFYYCPALAEVEAVIRFIDADLPAHVRQVYDCEDYAYHTKDIFALHRMATRGRTTLTAMACGIVWGSDFPWVAAGRHAVAVLVLADESVLFADLMPGSPRLNPLDAEARPAEVAYLVI